TSARSPGVQTATWSQSDRVGFATKATCVPSAASRATGERVATVVASTTLSFGGTGGAGGSTGGSRVQPITSLLPSRVTRWKPVPSLANVQIWPPPANAKRRPSGDHVRPEPSLKPTLSVRGDPSSGAIVAVASA